MFYYRKTLLGHTEHSTNEKGTYRFHWVMCYHSALAAIWNYLAWWFLFVFWSFAPRSHSYRGRTPMRAKTSSILSTTVNLDAEGTAEVKAILLFFWQVVFPSSYPRIRGKTVLRCPAPVYAEVTLCDVNSKASLQNKMHRLPQPPTPLWVWGNFMSMSKFRVICYTALPAKMTVTAGLQ